MTPVRPELQRLLEAELARETGEPLAAEHIEQIVQAVAGSAKRTLLPGALPIALVCLLAVILSLAAIAHQARLVGMRIDDVDASTMSEAESILYDPRETEIERARTAIALVQRETSKAVKALVAVAGEEVDGAARRLAQQILADTQTLLDSGTPAPTDPLFATPPGQEIAALVAIATDVGAAESERVEAITALAPWVRHGLAVLFHPAGVVTTTDDPRYALRQVRRDMVPPRGH